MTGSVFDILSMCAMALPLLAVVGIVVHFYVLRAAWKRKRRSGIRNPGFCPSFSSLGTAFQQLQVFHRPSMAYVLEAKEDDEADEDDKGDPETPLKFFHRQLLRIRRGQPIEQLVLRL